MDCENSANSFQLGLEAGAWYEFGKKKLNHGNNGHLSFPVTRLLKTTLVPIIFIRLGSEACDWA